MAKVYGTLTDLGYSPLPPEGLRLRFTPSTASFDGLALYSAKPVEVVPEVANGLFEVNLAPTDPLPALVYLHIDVVYRDPVTGYVSTERLPWRLNVPEAGGAIGDLLDAPGDPRKVYIGTEPPANASYYSWYLDETTGDLYQWRN